MLLKPLHTLDGMSQEEYATLRNQLTATGHIGGSMAGAVLGLNPYTSPLKAWLQLKGLLSPDAEETEAMWCGRMLEPALRTMLSQREPVEVWEAKGIYQHPVYPWMIATPDGFLAEAGRAPDDRGVAEFKTTSVYMAPHWADKNIADWAHAQILHTMAVTGCTWGYVGVLIGGQRFETRRVDADAHLMAALIEGEQNFVASLLREEMPVATGADVDCLADWYGEPTVQHVSRPLPVEALGLIESYQQGAAVAKEGEQVKEAAKAQLMQMLGHFETGTVGDYEVRWQRRTRKETIIPASTFRAFSIGKRKEGGR